MAFLLASESANPACMVSGRTAFVRVLEARAPPFRLLSPWSSAWRFREPAILICCGADVEAPDEDATFGTGMLRSRVCESSMCNEGNRRRISLESENWVSWRWLFRAVK